LQVECSRSIRPAKYLTANVHSFLDFVARGPRLNQHEKVAGVCNRDLAAMRFEPAFQRISIEPADIPEPTARGCRIFHQASADIREP
jgi:hypothetical protein